LVVQPLSLVRLTALCAIAQAIGMTAAASAVKTSQSLIGQPGNAREMAPSLSVAVGGGLVEGVALGGLQTAGMGRLVPALNRQQWVLITTAVAGVGWAEASAAAGGSGQDDGAATALLLILGAAIGLRAVMGALLGAGQAMVLRGQVRHPWRWVGATMAGWAPAMAVILFGASLPGAHWPAPAVVALAAFTALIAGTILGLVSGWFLPTLDGPSAHNRIVLLLLGTRAHALLDRPLITLRIQGRALGADVRAPRAVCRR
jgi:hypothetical protein